VAISLNMSLRGAQRRGNLNLFLSEKIILADK